MKNKISMGLVLALFCICTNINAQNIALNKAATQSSTYGNSTADIGVDGIQVGTTPWGASPDLVHTANESNAWWRVDLGTSELIGQIKVYNRNDSQSNADRLIGVKAYVGDIDSSNPNDFTEVGTLTGSMEVQELNDLDISGRYIMLYKPDSGILNFAELEVYESNNSGGSGETVWSESSSNDDIYYTAGNVGIGTTSPSSKLTVSNGSSIGAHHTFSDITVSDDSGHGMINILTPTNGTGYYGFSDSNDEYVGGMQYNHANDKMIFRSANHETGDLVIDNNGNIGIGTEAPGTWKLAVNGKIRAQELRIELANWPDYVFEEEYELPTLKEVENHIKEKGHLINIPSAKEVEADGIELGDMNRLLLEKIEELTLYVIELKKENELQQKEIEENKKVINQK